MSGSAYERGWIAPRLHIQPASPDMAEAWAAYYRRNRQGHDHLFAWEPAGPDESVQWHEKSLRLWASAGRCDLGHMFMLRRPGDASSMVGLLQLSQVVRGGYQSANLGFSIDRRLQGQGLMREALETGIHAFFSEPGPLALHRMQALVHPENQRSLRLLRGLGFEQEGVAKKAVFIQGRWHDHLLLALLNPR